MNILALRKVYGCLLGGVKRGKKGGGERGGRGEEGCGVCVCGAVNR